MPSALIAAWSAVRANWRLFAVAAVVAFGVVQSYRLAVEKRARKADHAAVIAASAEVSEAAAKAESAAILTDMARSVNTAREADELREVIDDAKSETGVGPATSALLKRLREKRSGAAGSGS